ncbi:MAG: hypothetical protein E7553_04880 [Ruminococcaceae bacterium]|nr:hypothetical protein [Oscillospiraceae bacterium]
MICPENIRPMYEWHTQVATYDVGPDRLLTPSAQLRLQQEAGERHFGEGGLNFEGVASFGMAFVVLQNNAVITRRPSIGEEIVIKTWSRNVKGMRFFRCYRFEDSKGNTLIDSVASFALVDIHAHTLLRPTAFPAQVEHHAEFAHGCPDPAKIRLPEAMTVCGEHGVVLSELDFNGHLNNTRYADIVFDHLPADTASRMTGFSITFSHEAKSGDRLIVSRAQTEDGTWVLSAQNGDQTCFTAEVRE